MPFSSSLDGAALARELLRSGGCAGATCGAKAPATIATAAAMIAFIWTSSCPSTRSRFISVPAEAI
jgi:hypothetical protein